MIFSRTSPTFFPVFPEISKASSASRPMRFLISNFTLAGSDWGKSTLLIRGIIHKLLSTAKYTLAKVWASTPCEASTTKRAPSQAAKDRDTS